jgi:hypothetical protein
MTRIRFTKYGACTACGEFGPGTIARLSPALAKHLVDDLKVAEYLHAVPAPVPAPVVEAEPVARKGKRK